MRQKFWSLVPRFFVAILFIIPIYFLRCNANLIIAYVSFLAVIVALFREKIAHFLLPPILRIILADAPEFFSEVELRDLKTGIYVDTHASMGIIVKNLGIGRAENVIVHFDGIESNAVKSFKRYHSIPMVRSWIGQTSVRSITKNVSIRFDIGFVAKSKPDLFNFKFYGTPTALININSANKKTKFKFQVMAFCDNGKAVKEIIEVEFNGNYTTDLNIKMLNS